MTNKNNNEILHNLRSSIAEYLVRVQDFSPGEYFASFWSEKAYHGPLLDYHAGGSHHHRGCGSAALALWMLGKEKQDTDMMHKAEMAFDWLAARQHVRGGWFEIQNNEKPSNWENTGLEELSTIESAFVIHGLGNALLQGLPAKKSYRDCLLKAGLWFLSIEWPAGSGIFPHHERSPYDTLNADLHAAESLALTAVVMQKIYHQNTNLFLQGARRSVAHALPIQWENGCIPYRAAGESTINYTALVLWCLINANDILPELQLADKEQLSAYQQKACAFLRSSIQSDGSFLWEEYETSSAKYNMWTYFITLNVLCRIGGAENRKAAEQLFSFIQTKITASGLPPMRDRGEEITECAFMQADILLFLLPLSF